MNDFGLKKEQLDYLACQSSQSLDLPGLYNHLNQFIKINLYTHTHSLSLSSSHIHLIGSVSNMKNPNTGSIIAFTS